MKVIEDLAKAARSMKRSGRLTVNAFTNAQLLLTPELGAFFSVEFKKFGCRLITENDKRSEISIKPGFLEFQQHNVTVESHSDSEIVPLLFGMVVVQLKRLTNSRHYKTNPTFRYYDENRKKQERSLLEGSSVVFNPRMPHEMLYFGDEYTVALLSVKKEKVAK